jgi:tight adherence protein C
MNLIDDLVDPDFLLAIFVAVCVGATLMTIASLLSPSDALAKRMKSIASERERLRERQRAAQSAGSKPLRHQQRGFIKDIVEKLALSRWLSADDVRARLAVAGFRGPQAETAFLFSRLITPQVFFAIAVAYVFGLAPPDMPLSKKIGIMIVALYCGIKAPEVYIKNVSIKRQALMQRALPDALDLLLICIESGMSIEHAFRRVSMEIGMQSLPLAEEFALTTAELSYLPDRRSAYVNLAARTELDGVKQITTSLIQAEKYGTALGQALRVTAKEIRDQRMIEAEKKGAALPPKLTVPMIVFFLPVLIAVILGPAVLSAMKNF